MRTFSLSGAHHYCESFSPRSGMAERSLQGFVSQCFGSATTLSEGTSLFEDYKACSLRDTERSLLLSASHYRRALDLMIPSSSHWAHVTLYYGAWFAARALLGMFGCAILNKHVIHVDRSSPGKQALRIQKIGTRQNQYHVIKSGSHQRFWEIFYSTVTSIIGFVNIQYSAVLSPISNNDTWPIEQRNKVNYDTFEIMKFDSAFGNGFSDISFPSGLPAELHTQYRMCEGILAASCSFAARFCLATDALDTLSAPAPLGQRVRHLIYDAEVPDLVAKTKKVELFGS